MPCNEIKVPDPPSRTEYPLTSPCGARLETRVWVPPSSRRSNSSSSQPKMKAIISLVHGGGWQYLAESLTEQGIFVGAYDQPSCGFSEPDPNAPRDYFHLYSMDDVVDEIDEAIEWVKFEAGYVRSNDKEKIPPVYLLGESFGGIFVLSADMETRNRGRSKIDGVICLGGLIRAHEQMLPPSFVITLIRWLAPYYAKTRIPVSTAGTFDDAFGDKRWATVAKSDPKVKVAVKFTVGAASATLCAGDTLMEQAPFFPVPLLAIHGRGDCRTQPQAMQEFVDRVGREKAELYLVDTQGHQLLQDQPQITDQVVQKIVSWLNASVEKANSVNG